jgi:hypothetical protein
MKETNELIYLWNKWNADGTGMQIHRQRISKLHVGLLYIPSILINECNIFEIDDWLIDECCRLISSSGFT